MNGYLLDTNHAGILLNRRAPLWRKVLEAGEVPVGVAMPVAGELWYMVFNSKRVDENTVLLNHLLAELQLWDFDARSATEFGRIKTELRGMGRPIPPVDVQVAAIARCQELIVVSADRHLSFVPGLTVENWLASN
ncbi:MAG: type II toxin-antitoxin system VapC family toxin [Phycisphaerales bacterium]|nr:type II toxin-antitoxin system VapC family toxin [Phycisphaerales bacterium]